MRSSDPLPRAHEALSLLQKERIPFILLTNGGGKHEVERLADLSTKLDVQMKHDSIVQSHTPFADLRHLHDKTVLVVGGEYDRCQVVAHKYGFKHVVTPGDIFSAHPEIWPFSSVLADYYSKFARPLPQPINSKDPANSLKIDAIFVYNDPRDWGLDTTIILDTLMSSQGYTRHVVAQEQQCRSTESRIPPGRATTFVLFQCRLVVGCKVSSSALGSRRFSRGVGRCLGGRDWRREYGCQAAQDSDRKAF